MSSGQPQVLLRTYQQGKGVAPSARRAGGQLVLRSERKTPNPDSLVVEDDESSGREIVGHRVEVGDDQRGDVVGSAVFLTSQQNHRRPCCVGTSKQLTKVGV